MVRAHLDDGEAVLRVQAEQRQRHADVIVEIAFRDQAKAAHRQDGADHFLGGCLAVAAGHRDDRTREGAAPRAGACAQSAERVRDDNLRERDRKLSLDEERRRASGRSRRRELVPIRLLALQRDEQRGGGQRARVDRDGIDDAVGAHETSASASGQVRQGQRRQRGSAQCDG